MAGEDSPLLLEMRRAEAAAILQIRMRALVGGVQDVVEAVQALDAVQREAMAQERAHIEDSVTFLGELRDLSDTLIERLAEWGLEDA